MIRRRLANISPEELVLIPIAIVVLLAILAQPTAITRLFESPYATPAPGEAPAERLLREGAPSPTPSPTVQPAPTRAAVPTPGARIVVSTGRPLIIPIPPEVPREVAPAEEGR